MKGRYFMIAGAVACLLAVGMGAFGAHALASVLEENNRTSTYETAVRYQFFHGIGLVLIGLLRNKYKGEKLKAAAWLFGIGMVFFSGSLYFISLSSTRVMGLMGAMTPFGGALFIIGWAFLILFLWTYRSSR